MGPDEFERILKNGESTVVEFKRCGATPGTDTFETICSFANRNGGNIFLGVADSGEVTGVLENSVLSIKRNIASMVNNPKMFDSAPVVEFEDIVYRGKTVIRIWVPAIQGVYRFKGEIFDRVADSDIRLRSDAQITSLYLRKYNIYTEQHIFPHLSFDDLRSDLIERARGMAIRNRPGHPWGSMDNRELLRSAQLWGKDIGRRIQSSLRLALWQ